MNTWISEKGTRVKLVFYGPSNVYQVSRDGHSFLVDAATLVSFGGITAGLKKSGEPAPSMLVLTHTHFDHAGSAAALRARYGLKIMAHGHDVDFVASGISPFPAGTTLGTKAFMAVMKLPGELVTRYPGVSVDIPVSEPIGLEDYGYDAFVMPTPGHSEGSLSIVVDDEIALVGDTLYGLANKSIVSPLVDDKDKLFESLCWLYDSGCQVFLPGHGPAISRERLKEQIDDLVRRRKLKSQRKQKEQFEDS